MVRPIELAIKFKKIIKIGFTVYGKLKLKYGQDAEFILIPGGIGDVYFWCKKYNSYFNDTTRKRILIVNKEVGIKVAKSFGVRYVEWIDYDKRIMMLQMNTFSGLVTVDIKMLGYVNAFYIDIYRAMEAVHGFSAADLFPIYSNTDFKEDTNAQYDPMTAELESWFTSKGCIEGRTVLLTPYAVSVSLIENEFWENLSVLLKSMNFAVITNIGGKKELPIRGTYGVSVPINSLVPFANKCGYVIGVRSGIFDIMEQSSAKKIVLYPNISLEKRGLGHTSIDSWTSFSINKWYSACNAFELKYVPHLNKYILECIMKYLEECHVKR